MLRVGRGRGREDRYTMLSPVLLELLRGSWRIARPEASLFTGQDPLEPNRHTNYDRTCHTTGRHGRDHRLHVARTRFDMVFRPTFSSRTSTFSDPGFARHWKLKTTAPAARIATQYHPHGRRGRSSASSEAERTTRPPGAEVPCPVQALKMTNIFRGYRAAGHRADAGHVGPGPTRGGCRRSRASLPAPRGLLSAAMSRAVEGCAYWSDRLQTPAAIGACPKCQG